MADYHSEPRALFLFQDSDPEPDFRVCSGNVPSQLDGQPCPFSDHGRIPYFQALSATGNDDPGRESSMSPFGSACVLQLLGVLKGWASGHTLLFPLKMSDHDLYKCRMMFLLILIDPQSSII